MFKPFLQIWGPSSRLFRTHSDCSILVIKKGHMWICWDYITLMSVFCTLIFHRAKNISLSSEMSYDSDNGRYQLCPQMKQWERDLLPRLSIYAANVRSFMLAQSISIVVRECRNYGLIFKRTEKLLCVWWILPQKDHFINAIALLIMCDSNVLNALFIDIRRSKDWMLLFAV